MKQLKDHIGVHAKTQYFFIPLVSSVKYQILKLTINMNLEWIIVLILCD